MSVVLLSVFIISLSIISFSLHTGISPMPSSSKAKKAILSSIHQPGCLVELGSGWGGLALALARAFPEVKVMAYEISPVPWAFSKLIQKLRKARNLTILRSDFFKKNLEDADVVVCYLCPALMKKLKPQLEQELRPGSLVISNSFIVPGWPVYKILKVNDLWGSELFIYKIHS